MEFFGGVFLYQAVTFFIREVVKADDASCNEFFLDERAFAENGS